MATWVELNLVATLDNLNDGFEPRILIGAPGKVAQALIVQVVVTDDADKSTQRNADASAHGTVGLAALGGVLGLFEVLQRGGADRLQRDRTVSCSSGIDRRQYATAVLRGSVVFLLGQRP